MAILCALNFRWIFFAALSAPSPMATKRNAWVQQVACVLQHHSFSFITTTFEYFVGAQYLKQLTPMRPPCTLYTAFCYEKIRAITRSTRIYISALERTKFVFLSCILMHQRAMTKSTSLFLSFTHAISTQQRSGNPSWQFYSLKIDNYDTQAFLQKHAMLSNYNSL